MNEKKELLKQAGTYLVGDLEFELTERDILQYCEMNEALNLDLPDIGDCINYKIIDLERKNDPFAWLQDNLPLHEAFELSAELRRNKPDIKVQSIWDKPNKKPQEKRSAAVTSHVPNLTSLSFDFFRDPNIPRYDFLRFTVNEADKNLPIKFKGCSLSKRNDNDKDFDILACEAIDLASLGFDKNNQLWTVKCHLNQKELSSKSLLKTFEFLEKCLWGNIWDRGSTHIYHSSFEYDPDCRTAKLVESQWRKDYYRTSEAFELILSLTKGPFSFGCLYKKDSFWVVWDFDSKERKAFNNCLVSAEWLCCKAYKRYDIYELIQHDFRLFELALKDLASKDEFNEKI